ncbi:MAG: laccase domain-containing protein [Candidatus Chisholmbacteria bacterium]|nr:laccase domain-containing protein [Candidatus Chisholmbacteria bacterium]
MGLIHLGWRGAAAGIHRKAINLLKTHYGSRPQDILVGIGPGICTRCFVSEKRPQQSDNPRWQPFITKKDNQWQVDIRGFVIEELQNAGIQSHHLEIMNVCTFENKNFFSHQRSKMTGEAEGRFASVIGIRN